MYRIPQIEIPAFYKDKILDKTLWPVWPDLVKFPPLAKYFKNLG